jgi:hypothetical protein
MSQVASQLSNREIALLLWLAIAVTGIFIYQPTRQLLRPLLRTLFLSKVSLISLIMLAYETVIVLIFDEARLCHLWMLKDGIAWLFGTATILLFSSAKAGDEKHYIRKIVLDNFKFTVLLTFVVNLYVFSLVVELFLAPALAMVVILSVIAATKPQYKVAGKLINVLSSGASVGLLVYASIHVLTGFRDFATAKNLEDFLIPSVLTLTCLPFIYLTALYGAYESLFTRIDIRLSSSRQLAQYTKQQAISACRFRLSRVSRFAKDFTYRIGPSDTSANVTSVMNDFRLACQSGHHQENRS